MYILGAGFSHPSTIVDNKFIEGLGVGTNAQWIEEKIGVKERRTCLSPSYIQQTRNQDPRQARKAASASPTDFGLEAARMALKRAGITAKQVGLLICNCCTPVCIAPTEGQRIAAALGIGGQSYDVLTACPAFALHIDYLSSFEPEALPDYVLCVSTATLTQHVNYNDRSDGAIWGDGAAAWVVSSRIPGAIKILDSFFDADPTRSAAVVVERHGHFHQDGRAVRDFSVRQTVRLIKRVEEKFNINWEKDIFIGHQANATMLDQVVNNRGIPESQHWSNVTFIGNQAGAGAPATLAMHWEYLKQGQRIVVAVVGAGLSWGSVVMEVM